MKADKCISCKGDGLCRMFKVDSLKTKINKNKPCYSCKGTGFETTDNYFIVCPHCGDKQDHADVDIYEACERIDCEKCGEEFDVQVETTLTFSTFKGKK